MKSFQIAGDMREPFQLAPLYIELGNVMKEIQCHSDSGNIVKCDPQRKVVEVSRLITFQQIGSP